jgi:uncharacterized protein (TIGR03084 family)
MDAGRLTFDVGHKQRFEIPMMREVEEFRGEVQLLARALGNLRVEQWSLPTLFKNWTSWDILAHLTIADTWAIATLQSRATFEKHAAEVVGALKEGTQLTDFTRRRLGGIAGAELIEIWLDAVSTLCGRLDQVDPDDRFAWFGPDMSARTLAIARYMEVWAHSQAIYDLFGLPRTFDDGIQSIALLGIKTFSFAYRNRGLPVPSKPPFVRLVSPSGSIWHWNEPSLNEIVEGPASEFCQVVTQCRNVADTSLRVTGAVAMEWMQIAQCFAGPPEDPPPRGARGSVRVP